MVPESQFFTIHALSLNPFLFHLNNKLFPVARYFPVII
jgi:hypothetical protein